MNDEQTHNLTAEEPQYPVKHSMAFASSTAVVMGLADWIAHFGPTGLVVGGLASYVAWKHGPELYEQVRGVLPRPVAAQAEQATSVAQTTTHEAKRSWLERAFGIPAEANTTGEEQDTVIVPEPADALPAPPSRALRHPIRLSPQMILEADEIVGAGINIFGVKGSGKTGTVARLAEQFARYRVSQVLFDLKGDLTSLVTDRRADGSPFVPNGFVGKRGRAPRGRSILQCGLQAVYDLRSWQTPEQMAQLICVVVEEMLETVALTPEGELAPCLVLLDEAEYWLPQAQPTYLSGRTYRRLLDAFHTLATMGRSRGLSPVIATQRIAKVNKDIIAQAEMNVLMKAVLDIDLDRYYDYFNKSLISRERIRGFAAGEAILCLPDGSQHVIRLLERESLHRSHTPHVTASLTRFASQHRERGPMPLELADDEGNGNIEQAGASYPVPSADQSNRRVTMPPQAIPPLRHSSEQPHSTPVLQPARARLSPELEQALAAWKAGATSVEKLEKALDITHHQAYKLYRQLREYRLI